MVLELSFTFSAWRIPFSGNQRKNGKYPGHFVFQILVLSKLDRNISVNQADLPVISEFNMIRNLVIFEKIVDRATAVFITVSSLIGSFSLRITFLL